MNKPLIRTIDKIKCFGIIFLTGLLVIFVPLNYSFGTTEEEKPKETHLPQNNQTSFPANSSPTPTISKVDASATSWGNFASLSVINDITLVNRIQNATLQVIVDPSTTSEMPSAFPDGKDCAFMTLEAFRGDGTFLTNEPLLFEKSDSVKIIGPETTDMGSTRWCATSTSPTMQQITVKLKNYPVTQQTINLNFQPNFQITDLTDTNQFLFTRPINFQASISPSMARGLKTAKLTFVYSQGCNCTSGNTACQSVNTVTFEQDMTCSAAGFCNASVPLTQTTVYNNPTGLFYYTYTFTDQLNETFQTTQSGTLGAP